MSGLEKILGQIQEEAQIKANEIIKKANSESDKIISDAQDSAKKFINTATEKAENRAEDVVKRAESAAELEAKQGVLKKKQELIDSVINDAYEYLIKLDDDAYFELIMRMIDGLSLEKTSEIIFSEKDKKRIGLKLKVALELKKNVVIYKETREFDGGFIICYGDIEENCTFKALFNESREALKDTVNSALFEKV
ncbi:MAG: V-type ATP synthase subunit E [Oscillospiraceae bacterium]